MARADDDIPTDADPAGHWPDTSQMRRGAPASLFELSHFDPLQAQKQLGHGRLNRHFDLCRPALALRIMLALQLAVALAGLPLAQSWVDAGSRAAVLAFATLAATLMWLPLVCALRTRLTALGKVQCEGVLALLGALAALLGWALVAAVDLMPALPGAALGSTLVGAVLALVLWRWLGLRAAVTLRADAGARLAELQSRIRPHFLFNALNTALALVQIDPRQAEAVLEDLAQLFRVALAETGSTVTLNEEIDLAQRYLAIEQLRFGDRLQLEWDLDSAAGGAALPPLVLQPLVENAVRHGIEPTLDGGTIVIRSRVQRGMAVVTISNSLPDVPGRSGNGIALANVAERLRLLHDLAASLDTHVEQGQYFARIEVPL